MKSDQLGLVPRVDFNSSALSLSGLSLILSKLNESGALDVRGIAPGTVNLLEIGAALSSLARCYSLRYIAGRSARERVESEASLWIRRGGLPVYRTSYKHKLLREPVIIESVSFEGIGLPR